MSNDEMAMGTYTHRVTLRAEHDSADLSILSRTLGMPAKRLWKAGEARTRSDGESISGTYSNSHCLIEFPSLEDLPQSLSAAISSLVKHRDFLLSLHEAGTKFSFFVGWFSNSNSRDVLRWELLKDLADLKISLDIDFYGSGEEPEPLP